jgi:putative NADH-flavin reductase
MNILIIGATGPLGQQIIKQGATMSHGFTALARRPEALTDLPANLRVVKGDLTDPASLEAALVGQDVVVSAFGSKFSRKPTTMLSDCTRHLVAAMQMQNVRRLICVTGIGAGDSKGHGGWIYDRIVQPLLLNEIYQDKTRQEEVIRASSLDWTLVRPARLTNEPLLGDCLAVTDLAGFTTTSISRADVAAFLLRQIDSPEFLHRAPVISKKR